MKMLLESGVHFGHQTRRWNPKMRPFIFTERNGIHIIDLQQTVRRLDEATDWVRELASDGGKILFVGTKKQAQDAIREEASRAEMPYVNQRWLGGMLTNFQTIQTRIHRLDELEQRKLAGEFEQLPKKEATHLEDQIERSTSSSAAFGRCGACRTPCSSWTRSGSTSPSPRRAGSRSRSSRWWTRTVTQR
jgi:small subunit ribosomal protein S2